MEIGSLTKNGKYPIGQLHATFWGCVLQCTAGNLSDVSGQDVRLFTFLNL
jgi:hypothetical protein